MFESGICVNSFNQKFLIFLISHVKRSFQEIVRLRTRQKLRLTFMKDVSSRHAIIFFKASSKQIKTDAENVTDRKKKMNFHQKNDILKHKLEDQIL